jgi:predicted  nucleic acid-binding Zn-ribbon protein
MDQTTINLALSAVLGVIGWFARQLWEAVQKLKDDIHRIEADLPKSYVLKDDMDKRMEHIEIMFQRIYDKIDRIEVKLESKADK